MEPTNQLSQLSPVGDAHMLLLWRLSCLMLWMWKKKKQQTSPLESERLLNVITHPASLSVSSSISPDVFILITSFPKKYRNKQARAEGSLTSREIKNVIYVHGLPDRCWPNCGMNEAMAMSGHSYLNTADEMEKILQFRLKCGGWSVFVVSENWRTTWVTMSPRVTCQSFSKLCSPGTPKSSGTKVSGAGAARSLKPSPSLCPLLLTHCSVFFLEHMHRVCLVSPQAVRPGKI